ncbi:uncharacterized protein LOC120429970 [Culex pipiens pallens]|uniref:uncharacterized protein LOC120429970 n=1 Tax=Culex pipiens pallens TaxID=42434 RepID=UPI00195379BA|nr:uncharacterized protein LOC120429970 [Culex pipiens pallens]
MKPTLAVTIVVALSAFALMSICEARTLENAGPTFAKRAEIVQTLKLKSDDGALGLGRKDINWPKIIATIVEAILGKAKELQKIKQQKPSRVPTRKPKSKPFKGVVPLLPLDQLDLD